MKEIIHPEDAPHLWKLTKKVWDYLLSLPSHKRKDYQFNRDYRILKGSGSYIHLLEQTAVMQTDQAGNVTHLMGVCTDISGCKKGQVLTATILCEEEDRQLIFTSVDDSMPYQEKLSKREEEVLRWIVKGYSSKQIAGQLHISLHTVNTHRKKMISKTNCKTTGALVQFAISQNLI